MAAGMDIVDAGFLAAISILCLVFVAALIVFALMVRRTLTPVTAKEPKSTPSQSAPFQKAE
jgi:hypothetical protein